MENGALQYIKNLKPAPHIHGRELLRKGMEIGLSLEAGRGGFIRSQAKYDTHADYKEDLRRQGKIYWNILMGLGSLEEQIKGIKKLYEFSQRTGLEINRIQTIGSPLIGLPRELRERAPSTTSFIMEDLADYEAQETAAPIDVVFEDFITTSPDGLFNTICCIKAGSQSVGAFTHFTWRYPGYDNDLEQFSGVVTALGVLASKRKEQFSIASYPDDGFPAFFMDMVSFIGYTLLEHYICDTLCNARLCIEYGGLMTNVGLRAAFGMAIHDLLATGEHPNPVTYVNGSTTQQWDHDIDANYGISIPEFLFTILVEKKYHLSLGIQPVSITEKLQTPTVDELQNIFAAGKRAEEKADDWLPFMNFEPLEQMRDCLIREGKRFFENILQGFSEAGIDISDPLELFLVLKNFDPIKFEKCFHPSTFNGEHEEIVPIFPTDLKKNTDILRSSLMKQLEADGFACALKGIKIVIGSGDTHAYGLMLLGRVLTGQGAEVVDGGVDLNPVELLDLADESGTKNIAVSCHNGQALDYARQMLELAHGRRCEYRIFMGGKLNSVLPGQLEPTDVTDMLVGLGIDAKNDIVHCVKKLSEMKI